MRIIHTSDFKNNTILAERGIKCVIRGYAFVKDTKKWLYKKAIAEETANSYELEDITLEELCKNCQLVTDEDKTSEDILENLFDVTYEPCLELTVPEVDDLRPVAVDTNPETGEVTYVPKGTILGGEKFATYKIRVNSALNNKTLKGLQGTYRAIVLIGEKYTEDKWHVWSKNKSYIAMWVMFGLGNPCNSAEDEDGLHVKENTAFTINLQFSLSQVSPKIIEALSASPSATDYQMHDLNSTFKIQLDPEYEKIMQHSYQKDQTTIKMDIPGAFLVPSGKEYMTRVELEAGVKRENEGIVFMDKTLDLIPNTYKNNNIFNVIPRVNIFDEHDDKFVKPQLLLSYGGLNGTTFEAQSIGFEYDPTYFAMNEKAPTGETRFDLFGGANKRENKAYDDSNFDDTIGYLRLLCDRGHHYSGEHDLFIQSNDNNVGMANGSLIISDKNYIDSATDFHVMDSRQQSATNVSAGLVIDGERNLFENQYGVTAFGAQRASATCSAGLYEKETNDPYICPNCNGTGKGIAYEQRYMPTFYTFDKSTNKVTVDVVYPNGSNFGDTIIYVGEEGKSVPDDFDIAAAIEDAGFGGFTKERSFESEYDAQVYLNKFKDHYYSIAGEDYDVIVDWKPGVKKFPKATVYFAVCTSQSYGKTSVLYKNANDEYTLYVTSEQADRGNIDQSRAIIERAITNGDITEDMCFKTKEEALAFITQAELDNPGGISVGEPFIWAVDANTTWGILGPCQECNGDGRVGAYGLPGRISMLGLNVSSTEFNGYNNFFIGHKGLLSNFGHDSIVFGNHNACGNREYNMCTACEGTGLVDCTACIDKKTGKPIGKIYEYPWVTCPDCLGYGYAFSGHVECPVCNGTGVVVDEFGNETPCPNCYDAAKGRSTGQIIAEDAFAVFTCETCSGKKVVRANVADPTAEKEWILCETCSGYGKMPDPICSGHGYIESYVHDYRFSACPTCRNVLEVCPTCSGKGHGSACTNCDGTGYVNGNVCPNCNGDGWIDGKCPTCDNDLQVCVTCKGEGTLVCEECQGARFSRCQTCTPDEEIETCTCCSGTGYVYDSYTDTYNQFSNVGTAWSAVRAGLVWDGAMAHSDCEYLGDVPEPWSWSSSAHTDPVPEAWRSMANKIHSMMAGFPYNHGVGSLEAYCLSSFNELNEAGSTAASGSVAVSRGTTLCTTCNGRGIVDGETCPTCNGKGIITTTETNKCMMRVACPICNNWQPLFEAWRHVGMKQFANRWAANLYNNETEGKKNWGQYSKITVKPGYKTCDLCSGAGMIEPYEACEYVKACGFDEASDIYQIYDYGEGGEAFAGWGRRACPKCSNYMVLSAHISNAYRQAFANAFTGTKHIINYYNAAHHDKASNITTDWGVIGCCDECNQGDISTVVPKDASDTEAKKKAAQRGWIPCPGCDGAGVQLCPTCEGTKHWFCTTCQGTGKVKYRPDVAYEDGSVIKVGDGYFYKHLMQDPDDFDMYRDYINIHPDENCDLNVGQYLKRMNVFSVESRGLLMVHNNNYDEVPDSNVKHNLASDFFAVRGWAQYDALQERFANLQNGCYAPDAIYFTKRTAHNEEWKLRIRELDYLIHDNYIKTNASMLKTAALNQAISEFYRKNTTFTLRLGPIITYRWEQIKGSKGAKGTKGWKGRKGIKGVTVGTKGKKGMKGLKGLKGTKGYKGMTLKVMDKRYKYYIEDILAAVRNEFGKYITNNGNLGKNTETYTFYCINGDPKENLYFKGVRLRKMANGNYQTLNAVKGIRPAEVQRIVYKDNGYYGEYGVMNFNYAYNNRFLA